MNTAEVKEVGAANGGTFEDRRTAHALAETDEPPVPLAEKVIDHDILCFMFDATKDATAFVDAASEAIGVAPGIFNGTMTATRNGEKFDLPVDDKDQAKIKNG